MNRPPETAICFSAASSFIKSNPAESSMVSAYSSSMVKPPENISGKTNKSVSLSKSANNLRYLARFSSIRLSFVFA